MNSYALTDRVAVVTGGAQGIGRAIADRFRQSGAKVAIWDQDKARADETARAIDALAMVCDVTDAASINAALADTEATLGSVDIIANSAGITGPNAPVETYRDDDWRRVIEINLTGTYLINKAVIPGMKRKNYGRIINMASVAGKEGNANAAAYSASKAGVIGLTKALGKELAAFDIGVNCITPAAAKTAIFDQMTNEHIAMMLSKIPRGRFVTVEEIANLATWLASAENSFTTAGVFDISGGRATY